jgi:heat shock protein HtpX
MRSKHFNGLKTVGLFAVMWVVVLLLGWIVGEFMGGGPASILVFAALGLIMTFVGFWNSDKIAIRTMRAYPVSEQQAPELYRIVRELSGRANAPMPAIYVSPSPAPNAFATGRSPKHAVVCVTEGILNILNERELRGVLGHELMHVYNRDILTASIAAALAGVIMSLARFLMFFGGGGRGRNNNGGGIIAALAMMLLAPFAAMLIRMAISRTREYDADHDGAKMTGDPLALASALRKIDAGVSRFPMEQTPQLDNVSAMMIANPFKKAGGSVVKMFNTHPPMSDRVARLEALANQLGQTGYDGATTGRYR